MTINAGNTVVVGVDDLVLAVAFEHDEEAVLLPGRVLAEERVVRGVLDPRSVVPLGQTSSFARRSPAPIAATLNGAPEWPIVHHAELIAGATIHFDMQ